MKKFLIFAVMFSLCLSCGGSKDLAASDTEGSEGLLCSVCEIRECSPPGEGGCVEVSRKDANFPPFLRVDQEKKTVSFAGEEGQQQTSAASNVVQSGGNLILQGVEKRAWSLVVSEEGSMVITASGADHAFVIFGNCTKP